jgi:rhodanese-related sulfurtransferase
MRKTKSIAFVALFTFVIVLASLHVAFASPHTDISVSTAWSMINNPLYPNLVILDVRNQSEYNTRYIPRSILIPLWQLQDRIGELSAYQNTEIIVHCGTGARSHNASLILDANNFTKVYDMTGGLNAWTAAGYPTLTGTLQGSYRNWTVVLNGDRIYVISPQTNAGAPLVQQVGMWDADYYGKLGKTVVDAAKPAIDECIAGCK